MLTSLLASNSGSLATVTYSGTDFDKEGLFYWIGTNGKTVQDWVNPAQ